MGLNIKAVIGMFWKLTYSDFNIRLVYVYNMKIIASLHPFSLQTPVTQ